MRVLSPDPEALGSNPADGEVFLTENFSRRFFRPQIGISYDLVKNTSLNLAEVEPISLTKRSD